MLTANSIAGCIRVSIARTLLGAAILSISFLLPQLSGLALAQGYALRFYGHGVNDIDRVKIRIDAPARPADVGATDFTFEWWMKANPGDNSSSSCSTGGDNWIWGNIIFDRDVYGSGDYGDYGFSLAGGRIAVGANRAGSGQTRCSTRTVADGAWHHIAVTRRAADGELRLFIDGTLDFQATGPAGDISYRNGRSTSYPDDPYLVIGAEKHDASTSSPSYRGLVDEVRISSSLRYVNSFARPSAPFSTDASTVALYHFDEGPVGNCTGTIVDSSGASGGPSNGVCNFGGSQPAGPLYINDTPFGAIPTPTRTWTPTATRTSPPSTSSPTRTATFTRTAVPPSATAVPPTATAQFTSTRTATATVTRTATPGAAQSCGNTAVTGGYGIGGWDDTVDGVRCTPGGNGAGYTVQTCRIYASVAAGQLRCALYDDSPDPNKRLLCESAAVTAQAGWNTLTLVGCPTIGANTPIWIAQNASSSSYVPGLTTGACNQPAGASYFRSGGFGSFPNKWGPRSADTCPLSMYVDLNPVGGAVPTATRTFTLPPTAAVTPTPTRTLPPMATPSSTRTYTATPVPMGTPQNCGNTTVTAGYSGGGWNNTVDGVRCTAGSNPQGYVPQSCRVYAGVASGQIRCALYDDSADPNKRLLCESAEVTTQSGWNTLPLSGCPVIGRNTAIWVTQNVSSSSYVPGLTTGACNQASGASYYRFVSYGEFPDSWGARTADTCALSMYAVLSPLGG